MLTNVNDGDEIMTEKVMKMNISDAEWEVMRIIWTLDEVKSSEIINQLSERMSWTESTIKTLIRRLVNKGLVKTRKKGRAYIYSAMVSENEMMYQVVNTAIRIEKLRILHTSFNNDAFDYYVDNRKGQILELIVPFD